MATISPAEPMEPSSKPAASPSKTKSTPTAGPALDAAPLDYFEAILKDSPHGTSNATTRFQAAHFWWTDPTPRQLADYDTELAAAARSDDVSALEKAVSAGRCLDARNKYGESLVHAACYGSAPRALAYVLRHGGSLKGCDATGRTPLHYACSARTPCFEIALQILAREPRQAHAFDARGKRALSSVPDQNRRAWCEFIYANRRALRGLASPEPRLVPPRVASPPPLSTVGAPASSVILSLVLKTASTWPRRWRRRETTSPSWAPRESRRVFDAGRAAARALPPPKNAGDERRGHHAPHALLARGQVARAGRCLPFNRVDAPRRQPRDGRRT